jgi:hypothetical protein
VVGIVELRTVIVRALDTVVAPALSRATAVSEYVPAGTFVHVLEYGEVVSAVSMSVESR